MDAKLLPPNLTESIRGYFQDDPSKMTMMAARKFAVPSRWWSTRSSTTGRSSGFAKGRLPRPDGVPCRPSGVMRVFVRNRAAVIESVGQFGGYSETGPFFNVQTDTLDMHILHAEIGPIYSVRKVGHDSDFVTHSFQFFDKAGDAAFKAFLWEELPQSPPGDGSKPSRSLTRRFSEA